MSISYDTSTNFQANANTTTTGNMTISSSSNRYLFVVTDDNVSAVSFDSVSLTKLNQNIVTYNNGFNFQPNTSVWGLANPNSGTKVLSITNNHATQATAVCAVCYIGVDPTQPDAYAANQTNGNQVSSQTDYINIVTDNPWIVTFINGSGGTGVLFEAGVSTTLRQTKATPVYTSGILDSNAAKTPTAQYSLITNWASGSGWFNSVMYAIKPYLTITFSGPASGNVNSASTDFTVTPDVAINGTVTITPSDVGSTGLDPIVLTFNNSATPQTFTITPTNGGNIRLTVTNGVDLNNPTALNYTAVPVVPGAPTIGTAVPGNTSGIVSFTAPASNGGADITQYTATSTPGGFTGTGTSSPVTVTGLTNGTPYTFKVKATNSAGTGSESDASNSVTPLAVSTTFTFTGPTSGAVRSASTNFTITPNNDAYYGTITITPTGAGSTGLSPTVLTFTSNTPQTFTITPFDSGDITLTCTNSGGLTNPANIVYTASAVVPLAPTISYVVPDINSIRVGVVAPTNDGGADITQYTITCSNGTVKTAVSAGEVLFNNLTPGTFYTFYVSATNSVGVSADSSTSDPVTPLDESARFFNSGPKFNINNTTGNLLSF